MLLSAIVILLLLLAGFLIYAFASGPKLSPETDRIIEGVLSSELSDVIVGKTGFASSGRLKIWYESISPESSPRGTVLLITAMGGNALDWHPQVVRAFVEAGYQVVRYDQRGTGMSDWIADWNSRNPYSVADMAGDAIAVFDELEIKKAHVVGLSMGGMVAQEIAIQHPERVASLTLLMTSGYVGDPDLPGLTSRYLFDYLAKGIALLKYRILGGEKNLIKERIAKQIMVVGSDGLDVKGTAEVVLYDLRKRKGVNVRAIFQHQTAARISGSRYEKLKTLNVPTLVVHGTADQFIPVEHGKKLVEVIPNAKGLWLDNVGHIFPVPNMDGLMKNIISHLDHS